MHSTLLPPDPELPPVLKAPPLPAEPELPPVLKAPPLPAEPELPPVLKASPLPAEPELPPVWGSPCPPVLLPPPPPLPPPALRPESLLLQPTASDKTNTHPANLLWITRIGSSFAEAIKQWSCHFLDRLHLWISTRKSKDRGRAPQNSERAAGNVVDHISGDWLDLHKVGQSPT
jgi:hypothetical protein